MIKIKNLYFYSLFLLTLTLPFSGVYTSLAEFLLFGIWVFDKNIISRLKYFFSRKSVWIFSLLFFAHFIWLINTSNFGYAFKDIQIKIPLLLFPLVIGTSELLNFKQLKKIIVGFSISILVSTIISFIIFLKKDYSDIRQISIFISHIRLSLYIDLAIFMLIYLMYKQKNIRLKLLYTLLIIWFLIFLTIIQAFTGLLIFGVIFYALLILVSYKIKNKIYRLASLVILLIIPTLTFFYIKNIVNDFYDVKIIDKNKLDKYTANGNLYTYNLNSKIIENGNYVDVYVCKKELKKEWNKISKINYDSLDKKQQRIKYTLKRYLTSKGLRKDSVGISKLTKQDIKAIESGCANYIYNDKFGIYSRIYKIIWQIDVFNKKHYFVGHSITQRLFYLETGLHILKNNFWFGTGTGDVNDHFMNFYSKIKPKIKKKFMRRTHNQFLTFFITFGIFGLLIIFFAIFYPVYYEKNKSSLFYIFLVIILLSVITEDTFETQAGVTFFSYFYSLLLFAYKEK